MCVQFEQAEHLSTLNTCSIPCQRNCSAREKQVFPDWKCFTQQCCNLPKMLDAIGKISYNGMHTWTAHYLAHMSLRLNGITMYEHQVTCMAFLADLKLVAPSRLAPAFIDLFVMNTLTIQILPHKDRCCVYVLALQFNTKGVIAIG